MLRDNYRVDIDTFESKGSIMLPHLPPEHTFVVTRSLVKMLTARVFVSILASEDPYGHMSKLRSVCKCCVG